MLYKGSLVDLEKEYAVVVTEGLEYFKVAKKGQMYVGKEILFLEQDIIREKERRVLSCLRYAAIFLILLLPVFFLFNTDGIAPLNSGITALVSIDINPGVEMELNREDRVMRTVAVNEDGRSLIKKNLKGVDIEEAVLQLLLNARDEGYLNQYNDCVLIASTDLRSNSKDYAGKLEAKIRNRVKACLELENVQTFFINVSGVDAELAGLNNMSAGRYELYRQINASGENLPLDQARTMRVQELMKFRNNRSKTQQKSELGSEDFYRNTIQENELEQIYGTIESIEPEEDQQRHEELSEQGGNGIMLQNREGGAENIEARGSDNTTNGTGGNDTGKMTGQSSGQISGPMDEQMGNSANGTQTKIEEKVTQGTADTGSPQKDRSSTPSQSGKSRSDGKGKQR